MKMEATLHSVKSRLVQTRDGGEITGNERYWDITIRIHAGRIDANELGSNLGDLHNVAIDCIQTRMPLKAAGASENEDPNTRIEFAEPESGPAKKPKSSKKRDRKLEGPR